jgi:hypothetical protein
VPERRSVAIVVVCLLLAPSVSAEPPDVSPEPTEALLRQHVRFLASDELAGRETGSPAIARTEEYVAAFFGSVGLRPLPGRSDFFVPFTLYRRGYDLERTYLVLRSEEDERLFRAGNDFKPFDFSAEGAVEAEVVFAGYGITAPEHDYDDYAGLDVTGKIVLVLRHEPGETDPQSSFDGASNSAHALFATKAKNAEAHGAAGMLLVTDPLNHDPGDDLRLGGALRLDEPTGDREGDDGGLLALHVSRGIARALVAPGGKSLSELQLALDGGSSPASLAVAEVTARIGVQRLSAAEAVPARNVAGYLEGGDPALRDEWIVVGAHHDHIGAFDGEGDSVFNGADDNASGTAGLLALARFFGQRQSRPRRSLVFVTFSAEEKGMLGSRALVDRELIPVERVVFMLNLDMIGRNGEEPVQVFGDGLARGLREIIEAANAPVGLDLTYAGTSYAGNSDHDAFYRAEVPFTFFFTGEHADYHRLGDHADKLDYERMLSIVTLSEGVIDALAGADRLPRFIHRISWLGMQVEVIGDASGEAAVVTGVDEGSKAAEAGLREGDVLLAFDDRSLDAPSDVGGGFRAVGPGETTRLRLRRGDEEREIAVERARRGFMGVLTGSLDSDRRKANGLPDGVGLVLVQVVPDGPSDRAGLRQGDIVHQIDGRPVGRASLGSCLAQIGAGETVEMAVILGKERLRLPVKLGERPR